MATALQVSAIARIGPESRGPLRQGESSTPQTPVRRPRLGPAHSDSHAQSRRALSCAPGPTVRRRGATLTRCYATGADAQGLDSVVNGAAISLNGVDTDLRTVSEKGVPLPSARGHVAASTASERESKAHSPENGSAAGVGSVEVEKGREALVTWSLVLGLLWKERARVTVAAAALVLGTVCNICIPRASGGFLQAVISSGGVASNPQGIARLLLPLAVFYVLEPLCTLAYVSNLCSAWDSVVAELRRTVFQRLLSQEISYFDQYKVTDLTALLSTELTSIEKGVVDNVSRDRGLRSLAEVSASLAMIFYLCPDLAPLLVLVVAGISIAAGLYKRSALQVYKAALEAQNRITAVASETLAAIRTVRSFSGEARQEAEFSTAVKGYQQAGSATAFAKSASEAWTRGTVYVSLVGIYALCGARVQTGQLAPGTLLSFVGYVFILTFAIQGFLNTTADLQNVFAAVARINSLVPPSPESRGERQVSTEAVHSTPSVLPLGPCFSCAVEGAWHADISFQDVAFSYPQRPDVEVLRGIDLHLPRGTVTALVGGSGTGKTTVAQLLSRFYEPAQGRVTLGKWNINWFDRDEWSKTVALVSQEPVLFDMSIRDNIAYGRPDEDNISMERIERAAKAANAHDFIMSLPDGYNTMVGERGSLLSGGQRQRIAIARAILKDSPILILDEATSALDSVSERLVQEALDKLMKGRTTLVIAHRLSTVQQAHQIVVLEQGRVVEKGSHLELLREQGAYADLVNNQHLTFAS